MASARSLLAVDPGLNHPAAALFRRGRLVAASRVNPPKAWAKLGIGERCRLIARNIHEWACEHGLDMDALMVALDAELEGRLEDAQRIRDEQAISRAVLEWPRVYRASKSKGDPNDLPPLVGVGMALVGRLDVPVVTYWPSEWAGASQKTTTGDPLKSPRGGRIWRCLDAAEQACVTLSHDALDAIGLGLFDLGRFGGRFYPGVDD